MLDAVTRAERVQSCNSYKIYIATCYSHSYSPFFFYLWYGRVDNANTKNLGPVARLQDLNETFKSRSAMVIYMFIGATEEYK